MPKEIKIILDDNTYQTLLSLFKGDEDAIQKWATDLLNEVAQNKTKSKSSLNTKGLGDYLNSARSKNLGYGAKGQGW